MTLLLWELLKGSLASIKLLYGAYLTSNHHAKNILRSLVFVSLLF